MFSWFSSPTKFLQDPEKKYDVKLIEREEISHDTRRFRFGLPAKNVLGLPIGQHIYLSAIVDGENVSRPYTPVSSDDDVGYFELVIKVYFKNVNPRFPDGGKLTQHLESLKIGDVIQVRGPKGRLQYRGSGSFEIRPDLKTPPIKHQVNRLTMIAGGTGIAPMMQIIRQVLKYCKKDHTKISLLFANQTEDDILLRKELEQLCEHRPDQLKVWYTLDRPADSWKYGRGFVSKDMIKDHLYGPDGKTLILMCGPPPMMKFVNTLLDELEYPADARFKY